MAREEFFDDIRLAFGRIAPRAETDSPSLDRASLEKRLRRAAMWLTPKSVEGYDPQDFNDLEPRRREELTTAVREYRDVAQQAPPDAPATEEQLRAGWASFERILSIVRKLVRDEWMREVDRLVAEAETWCRHKQWLARKKGKKIRDRFLGEYEVPQLQIYAEGHVLLDPVARYAPGASGLLDLAVLPSYESVMVTRTEGKWYIHPVQGQGKRREWSERAFENAVTKLCSLS